MTTCISRGYDNYETSVHHIAQAIKYAIPAPLNSTKLKVLLLAGVFFYTVNQNNNFNEFNISLGLTYLALLFRSYPSLGFERKVSDWTLRFYRSGDYLFYDAMSSRNELVGSQLVLPPSGLSVKESIEFFKEADIIFEGLDPNTNKPTFSLYGSGWKYESTTVFLFPKNGRMCWKFRVPDSDKLIEGSPNLICSEKMRKWSKRKFKIYLSAFSDLEFALLFKTNEYSLSRKMASKFRISRMDCYNKTKIPQSLYFEPISYPSKIDPRVKISPFYCGVTLVNYGKSSGVNLPIEFGHANLIIEMLDEENRYKMIKYDVTKKGERLKKLSEYEECPRSPVWKVDRKTVAKMLSTVEEGKKPRTFDLRGNGGLFQPYWGFFTKMFVDDDRSIQFGNCMTEVREKLKMMSIQLFDGSTSTFLAEVVTDYTYSPETYTISPYPDQVMNRVLCPQEYMDNQGV